MSVPFSPSDCFPPPPRRRSAFAPVEGHEVEAPPKPRAVTREPSPLIRSMGDARDPLQRFGDVGVRKFTDVLCPDCVHHAARSRLMLIASFERTRGSR